MADIFHTIAFLAIVALPAACIYQLFADAKYKSYRALRHAQQVKEGR